MAVADEERLADRQVVREEIARETPADDGRTRGAAPVGGRQLASVHDGQPKDTHVVGTDWPHHGERRVRLALAPYRRRRDQGGAGDPARVGGRLDARGRVQSLADAFQNREGRNAFFGGRFVAHEGPRRPEPNRDQQQVVGLEPDIACIARCHHAVREAGTGQEQHRERKLQNHECAGQPRASSDDVLFTGFEQRQHLHAPRSNRGRDGKGDRRQQRQRHPVRGERPVRPGISEQAGPRLDELQQRARRPPREQARRHPRVSASVAPSTSSIRAIRWRDAPSAWRTAVSRCRSTARPSIRLATLAQTMINVSSVTMLKIARKIGAPTAMGNRALPE